MFKIISFKKIKRSPVPITVWFFLPLLLSVFFFGKGAYTASGYSIPGIDSIVVKMVPENPRPNQEVSVSLTSYTFDINSAETTVLINGKVFKKGIGLREFNFRAPALSKTLKLSIISRKIDGGEVVESFNIKPSVVDLVYQLDNPYKPFGYRGRAEAISNSALTIFAIPTLYGSNGKKFSKNSLIYTWSKNYDVDLGNSGFGKSSYHIERLDAYPRETVISVEVTDLKKEVRGVGYLKLKPENTKIEFYLIEPALPFKFKNVANPKIISSSLDATVMAAPYFIDLGDDDVKYSWKINDRAAKARSEEYWNEIILSNSDDDKFTSRVKLTFEVLKKHRFLQSAERSFFLEFVKKNQSEDEIFYQKSSVEESRERGFFGL